MEIFLFTLFLSVFGGCKAFLVDDGNAAITMDSIANEIQRLQQTVQTLSSQITMVTENIQCSCDFLNTFAKCPDGWTQYEGSCYYFGVIPEIWSDAKVTCERLGGHLAVIETPQENTFVENFIINERNITLDLSRGYTWIGGYDFPKEGRWLWVTGKPFNYTNWRGGGPSNGGPGGNEDCLDFSYGGWNDHQCSEKCNFLCEREAFNK